MSKKCSMNPNRIESLRKIQEIEFAAVELNLFLDNNPCDMKALADFNCIAQQLSIAKMKYEMEFGPLINFGFSQSKAPWQWVDEPWPWEMNE